MFNRIKKHYQSRNQSPVKREVIQNQITLNPTHILNLHVHDVKVINSKANGMNGYFVGTLPNLEGTV